MNSRNGALDFEAYIKTDEFKKQIALMRGDVASLSQTTQAESKKMDAAFRKLAVAAGAFFSVQAAQSFISQMVKVRGEFQQLNIALETMLGSKEKADALMDQVKELAATTPFQLQDVAKGAKQLLAYGFTADEVAENLRKLGDLAAGVSAPLGDIVYLYGTMRTQGRAYAQDIRQFTNRGIPIIQKLADQFGVTAAEVNKLVSEGKVGFPQIEKAINSMTQKGGKFFNLMAKQSESLTGQISNLQDQFEFMLNDLGKSSEGIISGTIGILSDMVGHYEDILQVLGELIITYGAYKAAVIAFTVVQRIQTRVMLVATATQKSMTAAQALATITIGKLRDAWILLGLAIESNPIGVIAGILGTLLITLKFVVGEMTNFREELKKVIEATDEFITKQKEIKGLAGTYDELSAKTNRTKEESEKLRSVSEKLAKLYPDQSKGLDQLTQSYNINTEAVKNNLNAKGEEHRNELLQKRFELQQKINKEQQAIDKGGYLGPQGQFIKFTDKALENLRNNVTGFQNDLTTVNNELAKLRDTYTITAPADANLNLFGVPQDANVKFSDLIDDVDKNFKKLVQLASNKNEVEQIKKGLQSRLEALAPSDAQTSQLKDKLRQVTHILTAYNIGKIKEATRPIPGALPSIEGQTQTSFDQDLKNRQKAIEDAISDWLPSVKNLGLSVTTALDVALSDPFNDSMDSIKSRIEAINQMLKDGFYTGANGQQQILTPAQVQALEQAKDSLSQMAKSGEYFWGKMRELPQIFGDLSNSLVGVNNQLSQGLSIMGNLVSRGIDFRNSIKEVKESYSKMDDGTMQMTDAIGGLAGTLGAVGAVVGVVTSVIGAINRKQEQREQERADNITYQNQLLEKQLGLVSEIYGIERLKRYADLEQKINAQRAKNAERLADQFTKHAFNYAFQYGLSADQINQFAKDLKNGDYAKFLEEISSVKNRFGKVDQAIIDSIAKDTELLGQATEQWQQDITGISFDGLVDEMTNLFTQGKLSAEDFADTFEDLMRGAILRSFQTDFLEQQLKGWYDEFYQLSRSGGTLTGSEIDQLRGSLKGLLADAKQGYDQLEEAFGISLSKANTPSKPSGLAGAIQRSITEDTATELSGRINAMYLTQKDSNNILTSMEKLNIDWYRSQTDQLRNSIHYLTKIEANTRRSANTTDNYLPYLKSIDKKLSTNDDLRAAGGG